MASTMSWHKFRLRENDEALDKERVSCQCGLIISGQEIFKHLVSECNKEKLEGERERSRARSAKRYREVLVNRPRIICECGVVI